MSFIRYSLQTISVRAVTMCVGIAGGVINARWLGPEGVGVLALLAMVQTVAFRFGNLGLGTASAFFVAKKKAPVRVVLRLAYLVGLGMSLLTGLVFLGVWRHPVSPWHDIPPVLVYLALATLPIFFLANFLRRILSGQLRITVINLSQVIECVTSVALLCVFVVILKMGIMGALLAFVVSQLLGLLYLMAQSSRSPGGPVGTGEVTAGQRALLTEFLRYGWWNYLNMLTTYLHGYLPLFFVKYFGSNSVVGLFSVAQNLSRKPRLVVDPFASMLFPFTAASKEEDAVRRTNILCRNALLAMFVFGALAGVIAEPLLVLLYGEPFRFAARVFYVLIPAVGLFPLSQFLAVHVAAAGNPRAMFLTGMIGLLAAVVMCWGLVPAYGAIGAACAVSGTYFVLATVRVAVYVRFAGTTWREVLVVQKSDLALYQNLVAKVTTRRATRGRA